MEEQSRRLFGTMPDGTQVEEITLRSGGLTAGILTYGGAVRTLTVPGRSGAPVDVALGFDSLEDYRRQDKYLGALVGRVKEVGASWANVTLLWDPGFQMAGQGTKSGVLGSLEGSLDLLSRGELALACLTEAGPVSLGEEVVTFAAQGVNPSGLVVGTVMSLEEDPGGLTRSAILTPAADLNTLSQVFVVTAFWEER